MENTAKMYLDNRGVNEFFEKLITDERLNIIGENYRNKTFRRGRKYNRYNKYLFKNKILKAIKKGHYYLRKKETMECNVIILKHIKGDIRKIEKRIKEFRYDRYDLICFIAIITTGDALLSNFIEIPDVKFILKQLNLFGIDNLVELCS